MTTMPPRSPVVEDVGADVPPLLDGMRMDREAFHRVYCLHPEIKKAELIEGVVFVSSPVSAIHGDPHGRLCRWLGNYADRIDGLQMLDNVTLYLSDRTECQPDLMLFREPTHGGRVGYTPELYLEGVPELVAEISVATEALDVGLRKDAYERAGIPEYIIWRTLSQAIDWYVLREGGYELLMPDAEGVVRSEAFPGLWLDVPAMLRRDAFAVRRVAEDGIASRPGGSL